MAALRSALAGTRVRLLKVEDPLAAKTSSWFPEYTVPNFQAVVSQRTTFSALARGRAGNYGLRGMHERAELLGGGLRVAQSTRWWHGSGAEPACREHLRDARQQPSLLVGGQGKPLRQTHRAQNDKRWRSSLGTAVCLCTKSLHCSSLSPRPPKKRTD
jgi:hypothetical protein